MYSALVHDVVTRTQLRNASHRNEMDAALPRLNSCAVAMRKFSLVLRFVSRPCERIPRAYTMPTSRPDPETPVTETKRTPRCPKKAQSLRCSGAQIPPCVDVRPESVPAYPVRVHDAGKQTQLRNASYRNETNATPPKKLHDPCVTASAGPRRVCAQVPQRVGQPRTLVIQTPVPS